MNIFALYIGAIVGITIVAQTGEARASSNLSVLADLTISRAEINWRSEDFEPQGLAVVDLRGVVELPDGEDFHSLVPRAVINVYIGERFVIDALVSFSPKGDQSDLWIANESSDGDLYLQIGWRSATTGEYRFRGAFNPTKFALAATEEPLKLTIVLSLGDEMLTQEASVFQREWDRIGERYWRKRAD